MQCHGQDKEGEKTMNANEEFEAFADKFNKMFGYLPFGKDSVYPPDPQQVLSDLTVTFRKLEELKAGAALRTTSHVTTALVIYEKYCLEMGWSVPNDSSYSRWLRERLNGLLKQGGEKQPTA
jgi:hypothetical protein